MSVAIDENYCLLGILSDEPDYKLCWLMNDSLAFSFVKADDISFSTKGKEIDLLSQVSDPLQSFSLFLYTDESTMLTYRVIRNRSESGYFLKELQNIDYLLHIQGDIDSQQIDELIPRIQSINNIRMCVPVDLGRIKQKDRLQLW